MTDKTWFHSDTPKKLQQVLERLRLQPQDFPRTIGPMVRIVLGDPVTGEVWMEDNDVVGWIGRSCGTQKAPLLICANGDGIGGGLILTQRVLGVQSVPNGKWLYLAEKIQWPTLWVIHDCQPGYAASVATLKDGAMTSLEANFKTPAEAYAWAAFMMGGIPCLPKHFIPETEDGEEPENV